ncbi:aa2ebd03-0679-4618-adaf-5c58423861b3 [Thermothielavioides terrestris]|uniref:Aa2ebd03-0679-4618-adaf-5c58423861b3 n=1 Tax=Thermothielavioides terrestris TaxID=2587410 RepID=A0A3S4F4Q4_9PEZI|nr:aa2ebd03-0679-4618-adaf-5c58423861b3 [Thermothielavioides terrestris]
MQQPQPRGHHHQPTPSKSDPITRHILLHAPPPPPAPDHFSSGLSRTWNGVKAFATGGGSSSSSSSVGADEEECLRAAPRWRYVSSVCHRRLPWRETEWHARRGGACGEEGVEPPASTY